MVRATLRTRWWARAERCMRALASRRKRARRSSRGRARIRLRAREARVGRALPLDLALAGALHALAHGAAELSPAATRAITRGSSAGHLRRAGRCDRAADPRCARDSARRCPALHLHLPRVVAEVAARAGVHRRDELEARGKIRLARGARDGDAARFERLAQHLEHVAAEFRQLVEEEHAVVRERDLARARRRAAAHERHAGGGVVRRAERAHAEALRRETRPARGFAPPRPRALPPRVIGGRIPGDARGEHRLAGAGRAREAAASVRRPRRLRARAARCSWPTHIREIRSCGIALRGRGAKPRCSSRVPCEVRADLEQRARGQDARASRERRFRGDGVAAPRTRARRGARRTSSRAHRGSARSSPGERELAGELELGEQRACAPGPTRRGCRSRSEGRSGRFPWEGPPARGSR